MSRWFNTAGPCKPDIHYMLPAAARVPQARPLIEQQAYFVIHAPRQTGKTTTMMALAAELTASGRYVAVLLSVEVGAAFNTEPGTAELAILGEWRNAASVRLPAELQPPVWPAEAEGQRIRAALQRWAQAAPRPLVLFMDEIDALQDVTLISVLRQLRSGHADRPRGFPWSVALIGMRDVRDYKTASGGSERLNTASPFNIKTRSLTLGNFSLEEVAALYGQHTADAGQVFTAEAVSLANALTQGQPWLVNALAKVAAEELAPDPAQPLTTDIILEAKEVLIQRQETHLDSLAERLREPRVRQIIEPMLAGQALGDVPTDDIRFVLDLGLCRRDPSGGLVIANPIYREVIPRVLASSARDSLPLLRPTWLTVGGKLDPSRLLDAFLAFWRQHGQPLLKSAPYHEIAPHLVMMAFLHRVANAGGVLEREYAIGSGRIDLLLRYGDVRLAIELKTWRPGERDPLAQGLAQLDEYLTGLGLPTGWLVIFDQRPGLPPISERTSVEEAVTPACRRVMVIRG
ncbi:MAG: ATP-binding protein [Chloroflexi bacterium]|nr:ATP-binding protein [Chloroflexota bacterium]